MGKLSDDELAQLKALQDKENAPDEDEYEVLLQDPDGASLRLPMSKVPKKFLERFGFESPSSEGDGTQDEGGKTKQDGKPPDNHRYFR